MLFYTEIISNFILLKMKVIWQKTETSLEKRMAFSNFMNVNIMDVTKLLLES